jgi:two-component system CheB/CheR fusion protein
MHHHDAQNVMTEIPQLVVGIGASAGGLDPLEDFFDKMPDDSGIAFVIVQHLSPDYKSYMPELLARRTNMPVKQAADGERIEANHVYLIPTGKTLQMQSGCFRVTDRDSDTLVNLPIDTFFESLAKDVQERAVGIILSGTGTDGCNGIGAVAQAGGLIIAQNPESSAFDGMP